MNMDDFSNILRFRSKHNSFEIGFLYKRINESEKL